MTQHEDISTWPDQLEAAIQGTFISSVMVLEETSSTQDAAARTCIGQPKDHPATLIVASRQLMGRGQHANKWHDSPNHTLPCSIALGQDLLDLDNPNLAARAGLATLDTIKHFVPDAEIQIKWPNDIVVAVGDMQKKIAGILIEYAQGSIVVGVGINCSQSNPDYHPSITDSAISLAQLGNSTPRIVIACQLIRSLNHWLTNSTQDEVVTHWNQHDALIGTQAKLIHNNHPHTGTIKIINPLKEITLQSPTGEIKLPVEQTRLIQ